MNTLVNFESALLGLDGQFSVGGNTKCQKEVFHCTDDDSLVNSIARNRCIAIDPKTFIGNRMLVEEIQMGFIALKAE
nr:hypothetical protein [uncultured Limnohabitans sp.]